MSGRLLARCGVPTLLYLLCAVAVCGYLRLLLVPAVDWREVLGVVLLVGVRGWGLRYVVVHLDALRPGEAACVAALLSGAAPVPQADANLPVFDLDPLARSGY